MKDVSKSSANTALKDDRAGNREPTAKKESAVAAAPGQAAGLRGMKLGELLRAWRRFRRRRLQAWKFEGWFAIRAVCNRAGCFLRCTAPRLTGMRTSPRLFRAAPSSLPASI